MKLPASWPDVDPLDGMSVPLSRSPCGPPKAALLACFGALKALQGGSFMLNFPRFAGGGSEAASDWI